MTTDITPSPQDDAIRRLIEPHLPVDAHPSMLVRAVAFYEEINGLPVEQIAVLMAMQHIVVEGLGQALAAKDKQVTTSKIITDVYNPRLRRRL